MNNLQSIKEKLHKLIKLEESAQSIGNIHEAENAAARIQELMMKYDLELEDAKSPEEKRSSNVTALFWDLNDLMQRHEGSWIINLVGRVAFANMCQIIILDSGKTKVDLVGTEINQEVTKYMVESLITNLRHIGKKEFKAYMGATKRNTYLRGFYIGAVQSLTTRLYAQREEQKQEKTTNALMITRGRAVNQYIEQKYGRLGKAKTTSKTKGVDGIERGREVGKSIGLNKGVGGSTSGTKRIG